MASSSGDGCSDLKAFRFRLRHDHLLRQRLRRAKQEATLALARELGFELTHDDLQRGNARKPGQKRKET
jgi:predicted ribosomally synthesized peptide with nif11-like leader